MQYKNNNIKDDNVRTKNHSRESNRTVSTNDFSQVSSSVNMFFEFEHERKLTSQLQDDHDCNHNDINIEQLPE